MTIILRNPKKASMYNFKILRLLTVTVPPIISILYFYLDLYRSLVPGSSDYDKENDREARDES